MRPLRVTHLDSSIGDLQDIYAYIVDRGGSATVARSYVRRLRAACDRIGEAPHGGRLRADLSPGLRIWSFERRAVIAYLVRDGFVFITNVFYAGRDIDAFYANQRGAAS